MSSPLQDWFQCMFSRITDSLKLISYLKKGQKPRKGYHKVSMKLICVTLNYVKICVCMFVYWKWGNSLRGLIGAFYWIKQSSKTIGSKTRLLLAKVQLQQSGHQPEGMSSVGGGGCSLWLKVQDDMFISSFRFSFILWIKHYIRGLTFLVSPTQIYCLLKSLLSYKQRSCFSDSLRIGFTIYYLLPLMCPILNLWLHCNSCYIPQFISYLSKSCLPLTS